MSTQNSFANAHPFRIAFLRTTTGIPKKGDENSLLNKKNPKTYDQNSNSRTGIESLLPHRMNLPVPTHPGERETFPFVGDNKKFDLTRSVNISPRRAARKAAAIQIVICSRTCATFTADSPRLKPERSCCG
jgi:hypothetical protein